MGERVAYQHPTNSQGANYYVPQIDQSQKKKNQKKNNRLLNKFYTGLESSGLEQHTSLNPSPSPRHKKNPCEVSQLTFQLHSVPGTILRLSKQALTSPSNNPPRKRSRELKGGPEAHSQQVRAPGPEPKAGNTVASLTGSLRFYGDPLKSLTQPAGPRAQNRASAFLRSRPGRHNSPSPQHSSSGPQPFQRGGTQLLAKMPQHPPTSNA